nr:hypothetical protein [Tanacetum cinerariifolium]
MWNVVECDPIVVHELLLGLQPWQSNPDSKCERLAEYAKSMNIPFTFKIVMVSNMLDFNIDLLELDEHEKHRKVSESVIYGQSIRNIVAADGDERTIRHIGFDVWRSFFVRFGMVEIELSSDTLFEAKLFDSNFDCGNSCTVRADGGSLLIEWKDVPVFSVSAWKFV